MKKFCVLMYIFVSSSSLYPIQLLLPQTEGMQGQVLGLSDSQGTLSWISMESLTTLTGCLTFEDSDLDTAGKICANTNAFIIAPQGMRALQTTVSGTNRGMNAIDLQITTSKASMVASGNFSVITGGFANTAQGDYDSITGGQGNRSIIDDNPSDGNICGYNSVYGQDNMITINTASATTAGIIAGFNTIAGGNQNSIAVSLPAQSFIPNTVAGSYAFGSTELNPYGIAITPNGQYAYIADNRTNALSIFDLTNNTALSETINTGNNPYAIALTPDGYYAYVTNNGSSDVSVIDISNNTSINYINVGNSPVGIAITPDGQYAYVANANSNNISVINVATQTVTATINVGTNPSGVAITPDGQYAYVTNTGSNNISVINVATQSITLTITGGFNRPTTLAITPDGHYIYVTNTGSNYVSVIENNTPVGSIFVGSGPEGIAITPNGQYAYVLSGTNSVSVIDSATNQVIDTLTVSGDVSIGIAIAPNGQYAYVPSYISASGTDIINAIYIGPLSPQGFNVIGGGLQNQITVSPQPVSIPIGQHVIGGGFSNTITCTSNGIGVGSFIGGGSSNTILCSPGVIVGGYLNTIASGNGAFIGGGQNNQASGNYSAIAGGYYNTASGNYSVAGGSTCTAQGDYSTALGTLATTTYNNSFIWGDGSMLFTATASNTFNVLATQGARFITSLSPYQGVQLLPGSGAWISVSDKNKKIHFEQVDKRAILEKVAALPIEAWSYKSQDASIRHMGPYAQDFHASFGLGEDPLGIATIDADGVALAAIQGLYAVQVEQARMIALLQQQILELQNNINLLK